MAKISIYSSCCLLAVAALFFAYGRAFWYPFYIEVVGSRSVQDVVDTVGPAAKARLAPLFQKAGLPYMSKKVWLVAYKQEKILELWASDVDEQPKFIKVYKVKAASGMQGPKLREGDRQVPEGLYKIEWLHPNSAYHLSMKLDYPNTFDLVQARREGRDQPGTNIFIHGKSVSIGCLAMGDEAIEELFVLAAHIGHRNFEVIIAPHRPVDGKLLPQPSSPDWVSSLYEMIESKLIQFQI